MIKYKNKYGRQFLELYNNNKMLLSLCCNQTEKKIDKPIDVVSAIIENNNFIKANEQIVEGNLGYYTVEYINKKTTSDVTQKYVNRQRIKREMCN